MSKSKKASIIPTCPTSEDQGIMAPRISKGHPGWTEYLLDQLLEEEKFNDIPRMEGLRRLVEVNISPIKDMSVDVYTSEGAILTVIIKATVTLENGQVFSACSDANLYNCQGEFKNRLTPTADTRAKSKVFREILALRNTFSVEETLSAGDDLENDSFISTPQSLAIQRECQSLGVNLDRALIFFFAEPPKTLSQMKTSQATELIGKLSDIKRGRAELPKEIQ